MLSPAASSHRPPGWWLHPARSMAAAARADSNVYEYLETVAQRSPQVLDELYADAGACRCVFESLTPLAKQYIMRLVPCGDIWVELDAWLAGGGALAHHRVACDQMTRLRLMRTRGGGAGGEQSGRLEYCLHGGFQRQMLQWLGGSEAGQWTSGPEPTEKVGVDDAGGAEGGEGGGTVAERGTRAWMKQLEGRLRRRETGAADELNAESAGKWEQILRYMLTAAQQPPPKPPSPTVQR